MYPTLKTLAPKPNNITDVPKEKYFEQIKTYLHFLRLF
jgi:hypothetical protein